MARARLSPLPAPGRRRPEPRPRGERPSRSEAPGPRSDAKPVKGSLPDLPAYHGLTTESCVTAIIGLKPVKFPPAPTVAAREMESSVNSARVGLENLYECRS